MLLADDVVQTEVWRDDATAGVHAQAFGLLRHDPRHRPDARQVGVGVGLAFDAVLAVEELRDLRIGAALLADHIGRRALAHGRAQGVHAIVEGGGVAAKLQGIFDHGLVAPGGGRQAGVGKALQPRQAGAAPDAILADAGHRGVAEPGLQSSARTGVEAEVGGGLRAFRENMFRQVIEIATDRGVSRRCGGGARVPRLRSGGGEASGRGGGQQVATIDGHAKVSRGCGGRQSSESRAQAIVPARAGAHSQRDLHRAIATRA